MRPISGTLSVSEMHGRSDTGLATSSSLHGASRSNRHKSMDFGKFYQTSYLDMNGNVIKKGSASSPNLHPPTKFHRPDNFSYQRMPQRFGKPKKAGMLDLLRGGPAVRSPKSPERRSRSTDSSKSPERPADTEAVIKLSHYPSAQIRKDEPSPIEREDWPAPPATAVITKNLVRASLSKKYADKDSSDDDEGSGIDPKIQRELDEISKIQDSAMVKYITEDVVDQIQHEKKKLLDPRSASRTPSASKEPVQPPRFTSPINASPSRSLVERPRFISESAVKRSDTDRPVVHGATTSHRYRLKPGYSFGYVSKSLSTVPPGTPGAYVYDSFNNLSDDEDDEELGLREMERRMHVVDLVTRGADDDDRDSVFEPIPYSELNLSSANRRKGLSLSNLEKHLSDEEFEQYLYTTRQEFYKLPEFKRNDVKRKADLF